jgi:PAS domain S-box-containing protein
VAKEGQALVIPDARVDPRFDPGVDRALGYTTIAVACAPIHSRGRVIGVLEALNPSSGAFDPDALLLLKGIASLAGTALHHAQLFEHLQAAHQRYRELFEGSIDPIIITDWGGHILDANRQAVLITGFEVGTLQRMNVDHLDISDRIKLGDDFANLSDGLTISYDAILYKQGRVEVPVQVHARETRIEGLSRIQWILRDITERKNLDSLRNDLISMIYHDLRSPLANVISSLDVIQTLLPPVSDPALESLLQVAIRSTERIQRLTNSLLDMRRLETGKPITNIQPTSPESLIQESIEAVAHTVAGKNQQIQVEVAPDLGQVLVDPDMVRRVLINLMENAVKYTPVESTISVGALPDKDMVLMWVVDNGPGIPEAEHERVFDKFTRLHSKDGPKGLGLGLAFCRLAIEKHGGRIWVENAPGSGACFKFTLPLALSGQEARPG